MTFGKAAGLTAGFLGAFALGVAVGPSFRYSPATDVDLTSTHAEQVATAQAEPVAPVKRVAPKRAVADRKPMARAEAPHESVVAVVPEIPAKHPKLNDRLKPVLKSGADMSKAADGFHSGQEFATVAHAAHNTNLPFMLLKHRVLNENMSLASAILKSQPDANAAQEVAKARAEARSDVASLTL